MDAFTHFFVELALWNILLATLAFLFGLLMGHWMWGQFKKKLALAERSLRESENEVRMLADDAASLRESNLELSEGVEKKSGNLATELKASRVALNEMKSKAKAAEEKLKTLEKKAEKHEGEREKLSEEVTKAKKAEEEALEEKKKAEEKSKTATSQEEDWKEEKSKLEASLKKEKGEAASLREVISNLNEKEQDLKQEIEVLQKAAQEAAQENSDGSEK